MIFSVDYYSLRLSLLLSLFFLSLILWNGDIYVTIFYYVTLSPFRSEGAKQINHPLCGCASKVIPS